MEDYEFKSALIFVSNRLPFILRRDPETQELHRVASAGGLVTAVAPVVIRCKGLWVGHPGIHLSDPDEEIPESDPNDKTPTAGLLSEQILAVHTNPKEYDDYYNGCHNAAIWPIFHMMPERAVFKIECWKAFVNINKEFARLTVQALEKCHKRDTPIIWIHDSQLLLVAEYVREEATKKNLDFKMSFFLHIPFPPWDIFRILPWAEEILHSVLANDMIGFHTDSYCYNFIDCCEKILQCEVDRANLVVNYNNKIIHTRVIPVGIPFDKFENLARTSQKKTDKTQKLILGCDRLDYIKGVAYRMKAFEMFLERHPEFIEKINFVQISVPSRTDVAKYQEYKDEIDYHVGRINGRFGTSDWNPIKYIFRNVRQDDLAALYRDADVCLVTPLLDGMNLVCKEYVACQIGETKGVLVLSMFAGAAEFMLEALPCNPYDLETTAEVINSALVMPVDEKIKRMEKLRKREIINDVDFWLKSFLRIMASFDIHEDIKKKKYNLRHELSSSAIVVPKLESILQHTQSVGAVIIPTSPETER